MDGVGASWRARGVDALILAATLVPLVLTAHLPLSDLPNHLARQVVLRDLAGSGVLRDYYAAHWALVPNLALELFVQPLACAMSVDLAVRLFVIASVALLFGGVRSVNRAVSGGRATSYRAAPLLIYGGPFQFGFLNFCFGIGAALLLGGWYLRRRERGGWILVLLGAGGLLLCHPVAFVLFAVLVGSAELVAAWPGGGRAIAGRALWAASALVSPLLLFAFASPTAGEAVKPMIWSTLQQRAESIAAITLFASPLPELALLLAALIGLAAALAVRAVRPHPLALSVGVMALLWVVAPRSAMGGGYLDYRLPWATALLALGVIVPGPRWDRFTRALAGWFGALAVGRVVLIAALWLRWEAVIAPIDASLARLPEGARLLVVQGPTRTSAGRRPSLLHVGSYAVARAHAFTPTLYAGISGQVLDFREPWRRLRHFTAPQALGRIDPAYTHVLVIEPATATVAPHILGSQLARGVRFALYRVQGQAARGTMRSRSPFSARFASSNS